MRSSLLENFWKYLLLGESVDLQQLELFQRILFAETRFVNWKPKNRVYQLRHRLEGVVSEVHEHEQAAVSPSFILDSTETTQVGSSRSSWFSLCLLCLCFLVPVCCVWSEKRKSDVCTWELWETFLYLDTGLVLYRCT